MNMALVADMALNLQHSLTPQVTFQLTESLIWSHLGYHLTFPKILISPLPGYSPTHWKSHYYLTFTNTDFTWPGLLSSSKGKKKKKKKDSAQPRLLLQFCNTGFTLPGLLSSSEKLMISPTWLLSYFKGLTTTVPYKLTKPRAFSQLITHNLSFHQLTDTGAFI